ncbi:AIM23 [Candida pseudojiufengensis]|uniref:AIM23 n=1 Tax=Candida pseudojiufengensis TaxID=497109 RepID=UPI0022252991|nr:AIM23 [Candida pseudojiufengensis]KAI5961001.1 AIM23 [Candida pseudojiufengensis]
MLCFKQPIRILLCRRNISTSLPTLNLFDKTPSRTERPSTKSSTTSSSSIFSSNRFQEQYNKSKSDNSNQINYDGNKRIPRHSHQNLNNRSNNRHQQQSPKFKQKPKFDLQKVLEKGSESSQNAIKSILTKLYNLNTNYEVEIITETGLKKCKIQEILADLNLQKQGIQLILRDNNQLPIIKFIKIQEMLKNYNDELAESKELELLKIGSIKTIKSLDNKLKLKQKQSMDKNFLIKWSISINDLINQKFNELIKTLKKHQKLNLFIISNKSISFNNNPNITNLIKDNDQLSLEIKKRQLIKDKIENYLIKLSEDSNVKCKWNLIDGDINTRLHYNISCINQSSIESNSKEKIDVTPEVKPVKIKKAQTQTQEKAKSKIDEDELDSLYSFKIED